MNPVVNIAANRPPDSEGWHNHTVTFSASTSTDTGGSGIFECDDDVVYPGPDTSTGSLDFSCEDNAGNTATDSVAFKFDATTPVSTATGHDSSWHNSAVTVHLSATDPNGYRRLRRRPHHVFRGRRRAADHYGRRGRRRDRRAVRPQQRRPAHNRVLRDGQRSERRGTVEHGDGQDRHDQPRDSGVGRGQRLAQRAGNGASRVQRPRGIRRRAPVSSNLRYQVDAGAPVDIAGASGVADVDVTIPAPANGSNDGVHTISYHATDDAGNIESSGSVTVKIDATKPTIVASAKNGRQQRVRRRHVDEPERHRAVHVQRPGRAGHRIGSCLVRGRSELHIRRGHGVHERIRRSDNAGNSDSTSFGPIKIDKAAPSVTITQVNGSSVSFPFVTNVNVTTISGTCGTAADGSTSADAGTVQVSIMGAASQSGAATCTGGGTWTYTTSPALSADGGYTVNASQDDGAGNTGHAASRSITIDKTAPVVTLDEGERGSCDLPAHHRHGCGHVDRRSMRHADRRLGDGQLVRDRGLDAVRNHGVLGRLVGSDADDATRLRRILHGGRDSVRHRGEYRHLRKQVDHRHQHDGYEQCGQHIHADRSGSRHVVHVHDARSRRWRRSKRSGQAALAASCPARSRSPDSATSTTFTVVVGAGGGGGIAGTGGTGGASGVAGCSAGGVGGAPNSGGGGGGGATCIYLQGAPGGTVVLVGGGGGGGGGGTPGVGGAGGGGPTSNPGTNTAGNGANGATPVSSDGLGGGGGSTTTSGSPQYVIVNNPGDGGGSGGGTGLAGTDGGECIPGSCQPGGAGGRGGNGASGGGGGGGGGMAAGGGGGGSGNGNNDGGGGGGGSAYTGGTATISVTAISANNGGGGGGGAAGATGTAGSVSFTGVGLSISP